MLSDEQRQQLEEAARRSGMDPAEVVSAGERLSDAGGKSGDAAPDNGGRPLFERLLIGTLPFIRVRELRQLWLKLEERIPDDELMCGEFAAKYGGTSAGSGGADE